jgi:MFS family permease
MFLTQLTSIFGRILPGIVADKVGRFNTMVVMTCLSAVFVLAVWLPAKSNAVIILFAALYGFSSGTFVSLLPALIAQISDIRQIGVRTGTMFAVVSIAALCGEPIAGALVSANNGAYTYLQIFSGVMLAAGTVLFVLARVSEAGLKPKKI